MSTHTPGRTVDEAANRLVDLRRFARLERKEMGRVSASTVRKIHEAIAAAEAVCVVDDARAQSPTQPADPTASGT